MHSPQTLAFSSFATKDTPRFADLGKEQILDPILLDTITQDLKFDYMMPVQAATLHELLQNRIDCLAQARTGTGKTIAFLLPAIQNMMNSRRGNRAGISTLILTPTRELAIQIQTEAEALLQRFPQYKVTIAIGGTNKNTEARRIADGCDILVATPGRLIDHMSAESFKKYFRAVQTLVLDEADRMLDMGFLPSIKQIIGELPNKAVVPRQSMLFSATFDQQIRDVSRQFLNEDYKFISTIPKGEGNTHERVPQFYVEVAEMSDLAPALLATIRAEQAEHPNAAFKAIIFAPTAALADFYGHVLENSIGMPKVSVLHSRKSQSTRTRLTEDFKKSTNAIVVATDVIARGMDFPNVSHVIQTGMPSDKESYIHRIGRTARAEADGRGVLILTRHENWFLRQMKDISFQALPTPITYSRADVEGPIRTLENPGKVYQAWLGYYKTSTKQMNWTTTELVQQANKFAREGLGCPEVPGILRKTVGMMGLKGVPGLNIVSQLAEQNAPTPNGNGRQGNMRQARRGPVQLTTEPAPSRRLAPGRRRMPGQEMAG
jgi:ATP-dependent RNA helicase MSS116, mitochondrial